MRSVVFVLTCVNHAFLVPAGTTVPVTLVTVPNLWVLHVMAWLEWFLQTPIMTDSDYVKEWLPAAVEVGSTTLNRVSNK